MVHNTITNYITLNEASENWAINIRRLQILCKENKIKGSKKISGVWFIPVDSKMPVDGREKSGKYKEDIWDEERLASLENYILTNKPGTNRRIFRRIIGDMADYNIEEYINDNKDKSFSEYLFMLIDERKLDDVYVYKKAGVDRRVFSKIKTDNNYQPSFETCVRFSFALGLNVSLANRLLEKAGYYLSKSKKRDLVIMYCLENKIDDYSQVLNAMRRLEK